MSSHIYALSSLPAMPQSLDEPAPMAFADFRSAIRGEHIGAVNVLQAIMLELDVQVLEQKAKGLGEPAPALLVLTREQLDGRDALPDALVVEEHNPGHGQQRNSTDVLWEAYYRHVLDMAGKAGSGLLDAYTRWDIGLRNALVEVRCRQRQQDPEHHMLLAAEGPASREHADIATRWQQAATPLEGERMLDKARWDFLGEQTPFYDFSMDELVGYALRLKLLTRWTGTSRDRGAQVLKELVA